MKQPEYVEGSHYGFLEVIPLFAIQGPLWRVVDLDTNDDGFVCYVHGPREDVVRLCAILNSMP